MALLIEYMQEMWKAEVKLALSFFKKSFNLNITRRAPVGIAANQLLESCHMIDTSNIWTSECAHLNVLLM